MDRPAVLAAVVATAVEVLRLDPDRVTEQASWADDLEADSLDLTELVMALEDRFSVEVPEEALEDVRTVGDAADAVLAQLGTPAPS